MKYLFQILWKEQSRLHLLWAVLGTMAGFVLLLTGIHFYENMNRVLTENEDQSLDGDPTNDDADNDGTPNYLDTDSDDDGLLDPAAVHGVFIASIIDRIAPDTETVVHLITHYLNEGASQLEAIQKSLKRLTGAFALGAGLRLEPY